MKQIINFRIDLLRRKFKIYGTFNVISFIALLAALFLVPKYILVRVGHYTEISALIAVIYYSVFSGILMKTNENDIKLTGIFYQSIDRHLYRIYMEQAKFYFYHFILIWLILPLSINDVRSFIAIWTCFEVFIAISTIINKHAGIKSFETFRQVVTITIAIAIILGSRGGFDLQVGFRILDRGTALNFLVLLIAMFTAYRNIGEENGISKTRGVFSRNKNGRKLKNKDFAFFIRTNCFTEPCLMFVLSCVISIISKEAGYDSMLTCLTIYCYLFYYIYTELIRYEEGCWHLLYQGGMNFKRMKREKIKNTIQIAFIFFLLSLPFMLITVSLQVVGFLFFTALVLFWINTHLYRFNFEKQNGNQKMITDKEQIVFIVLYIAEIITVTSVMEKLM